MDTTIKARNSSDMCIIPLSDLSEEGLFNVFQKNDGNNIIYITENDSITLIGVITVGDFKRYEEKIYNNENITDIINRNCLFLYENEEKSVEDFLRSHKKIHSVPIINSNKQLIKEYYEEDSRDAVWHDNEVSSETIRQYVMDAEVLLARYKRVVFFTDNELWDNNVIPDRLSDKIQVLQTIRLMELNDFRNDTYIYDLRKNIAYAVVIPFFKKAGMDFRFMHPDFSSYTKQNIYMQMQLYNSIGIFCSDKEYFSEAEKYNPNIHWLDIASVDYNREKDLYEYSKNDRELEDIECIFMPIAFFSNLSCAGKKRIPIFSSIFTCTVYANNSEGILQEPQAQDYDIAYNIIPQFRKNGIKYLILKNPEREQGKMPSDIVLHMKNVTLMENALENMIMYDDAEEFLEERARLPQVMRNGFPHSNFFRGKYFRLSTMERYTKGNPKVYSNTIYLFGPCICVGAFVKDEDTMASCLSNRIDNYYIKSCGATHQTIAFRVREEHYQPGDIVVIMAGGDGMEYRENGIEVKSLLNVYKQIPNLEEHIYDSLLHCNRYATRHIADFIYENISDWLGRNLTFGNHNKNDFPYQLEEWLARVQQYKVIGKKAGAIVMNANPFTKGHRYLVEEACKKVEVLYIFVVQEDKSFFSFNDRLNMVQLGTHDISNVVVIPSGSYIISTVTLPGYFDKETMPEVEFDASEDLEIFSKIIAPAFEIAIRFAGTEPNDNFTRRYNEFMSDILPQNGVEFCEIPRKKQNGEVISASRVRKHLEQKQYDGIQDLVLPEIYEYLKQLE